MEIQSSQAGLPIREGRILLRPMFRQDVDTMAGWPYHLDPFYSRGAKLPAGISGRDRWWRANNREPFSILLAAEDKNGRLIGRVSITRVDESAKEGVMGIRIHPEYENLGFGTDLLRAFMQYWFVHRDMDVLTFDANYLNKRAASCYQKVGVPTVGYHYEYQPHLVGQKGIHPSGFVKFYDYRISKAQYFEHLAHHTESDCQLV